MKAISSNLKLFFRSGTLNRDISNSLKQNNFDLLRLVFASMVVLFHLSILSESPQLSWLSRNISATFAVQAFFFVSGFLVMMSCERSSSLTSYFSKRIRRIAPAYIVVVVGAAILLVSISRLTIPSYFADPGWRSYLFFNLLLSNFTAPSLPGVFSTNPVTAVNASLWTIKIEVAFYFAVPLILWLIRRFEYKAVLISLFTISLVWKASFHLAFDYTGIELYSRLAKQLPGQIAFFMGGALAYFRTRAGLPPPPIWLVALAILFYSQLDGLFFEISAPFAVTVIVYWLSIEVPKITDIGKRGDFSYGIYLYHFPIIQLFVSKKFFGLNLMWASAFIISIVLILSFASWFLIESRFLHNRSGLKV